MNLKEACYSVLAMKDLAPSADGKTTWCNQGVRRIFLAMGKDIFGENELSHDQISKMLTDKRFSLISGMDAHHKAMAGYLVVAAKFYKPTSHVAVVFPADKMGFSGHWNKDVPMLANIGKKNGVFPCSECFPVKQGEPLYLFFNEMA